MASLAFRLLVLALLQPLQPMNNSTSRSEVILQVACEILPTALVYMG